MMCSSHRGNGNKNCFCNHGASFKMISSKSASLGSFRCLVLKHRHCFIKVKFCGGIKRDLNWYIKNYISGIFY